MSVWEKIKDYAPTVAAAVATGGTAIPAAAIQILSKELFGKDDQPLERVEFELAKLTHEADNGNTEAALKLRELETNSKEKLLAMHYQSISDARERDIAIQEAQGGNARADKMMGLAFFGFFGCLSALIFLFLFDKADPGLVAVIASFGTKFLGQLDLGYAFEFGGSADGTKANNNIAEMLGRKVKGKGDA